MMLVWPKWRSRTVPKIRQILANVFSVCIKIIWGCLEISEEDLIKINEQRRSERWGHYVETKAAIEVYGSTHKKEIKDGLTLVQFFDLDINEESY